MTYQEIKDEHFLVLSQLIDLRTRPKRGFIYNFIIRLRIRNLERLETTLTQLLSLYNN